MHIKEKSAKGKAKGNPNSSKPKNNVESSKKNNKNEKRKGGEGSSGANFVAAAERPTQRCPKHGKPTYDKIMNGKCTFHGENSQHTTQECMYLIFFVAVQSSALGSNKEAPLRRVECKATSQNRRDASLSFVVQLDMSPSGTRSSRLVMLMQSCLSCLNGSSGQRR